MEELRHQSEQAEENLRRSERKFRAIFDQTFQFMGLMTVDGTLMEANRTALDFIGMDAAEVTGKPFWETPWFNHSPDIQDQLRAAIKNASEGNLVRFETIHTARDGTRHYFDFSIKPVKDDNGNVVLLIPEGRDITDRKRAEEILLKSERLLRRAEEVANFGHWEFLLDENIVYASEAARTIYGLETRAWSISDVQSIPLPEYRTMLDAALTGLVKLGTPYNVEFKICRPTDRKIIDIHTLAEYDAANRIVFGVIHDITERKLAEDALRESEEKYRSLFEESRDVVFISTAEGKFLDINPAGVRLFGYSSKEEFLNIDINRDLYLDPGDCTLFRLMLYEQGFVKDYEVEMKKKTGEKLTVLITSSTVRYNKDDVIAYRGIIRDITDHKKLEQQLLHSQKMEAVGQLAGGVAHDFNNILSAIMGYSSLLQIKTKEDLTKTYTDQILSLSEKAAALTQSLLAFSRKQIIKPQPADLNEIVTTTGKLLKRIIGEDIELRTMTSEEQIIVYVDRGQIEQVLMNLATNARHAMPNGGILTISAEPTELNRDFIEKHEYGEAGKYALLSISDTGIGMDEKTRERIFEPFFTTKEVGKGTGLGLAIVYGIIKQHNGYINVYSEPGIGTIFRIYLAVVQLKAEEAEIDEQSFLKRGTETILLAEDDGAVRETTKAILEEFGYKVIEAEDGEEAVRHFLENKDTIKLLITDVIMPRKNGREAYNQIKSIRPGIKALFTSGYTAELIHQQGLLDEELELISKPVSPKELLKKIRQILDK